MCATTEPLRLFVMMFIDVVHKHHIWVGKYYLKKANENAEIWSLFPVELSTKHAPHLRLREHYRRGGRKIVKAEDQAVSCEIVSPNNIKSHIHKVSPI